MQASQEFLEIARQHYADTHIQESNLPVTQADLGYRYPLFCFACNQETMHKALEDAGNAERYQCRCGAIKW